MGYVVIVNGIKIDFVKIEVIRNVVRLINVSELWSFLGLMLYYWKFIKDFVKIVKCLYVLISKEIKWNWIDECDYVFYILKEKFVSVLIFGYFDLKVG